MKGFVLISLDAIIMVLLSLSVSQFAVEVLSEGRSFYKTSELPARKVGLLLGTGKFMRSGNVNLYYKYRLNAAADLYKSGKVKYILISGDNGNKNYDEPSTMQDDLVALGIPRNRIVLDYAGFRTLDSMVRCKEVFKTNKLIVISQRFHNERAICIARAKGMDVLGFNARDVGRNRGLKTKLRERFARVKMFIDLALGVSPKYLGDTVEIG